MGRDQRERSPSERDDEMWTSPVSTPVPRSRTTQPKTPVHGDDTHDPEAALRRELEGIKAINEAVEAIIATLEHTQSNMNTVSSTIGDASTLLNTWTRILSQTEHNQRLILDPGWRGAAQDLMDVEAEAARQQQQQAERCALEEERRREEARRRAAELEEESRARAGVSADARARRGGGARTVRGRGVGRGMGMGRGSGSGAGAGTAGPAGEGGVVRSRSIIGRGVARYRPRGAR